MKFIIALLPILVAVNALPKDPNAPKPPKQERHRKNGVWFVTAPPLPSGQCMFSLNVVEPLPRAAKPVVNIRVSELQLSPGDHDPK